MPSTWSIFYSRWIIEDGEPDREVGECFRSYVVEFSSTGRLTPANVQVESAIDADDYSYDVVAKVIHVSATAGVIDFGLRAIGSRDLLPASCQTGEYVAGRITLWFQHWCHPVPTDLIVSMARDWSVQTILADLTPHRPGDETGRWRIRDVERIKYEQITSTRSKHATAYVLQSCLVDAEYPAARAEAHSNQ